MIVRPIRTKIFLPPKDVLLPEIFKRLKRIPEKSILAITSKVVSINQGRCILASEVKDRDELIKKEADWYLPRRYVPGGFVSHTLKNNLIIPSAGIDESNANGYYILWPKHIKKTAENLWKDIRSYYRLKKFGILITDSHSIFLRRGVVGISLAHYGFRPLNDYRGKRDIFGFNLSMSQANIADAMAAAATAVMGEGKEQTPIVLMTDIPFVCFDGRLAGQQRRYSRFMVPLKQDIYYPFLKSVKWQKKK